MKTHLLYLIAGFLVATLFAGTYYKAHAMGYSQGWSDAQCGKNQVCEAGQE